jgi:hypothetical protein
MLKITASIISLCVGCTIASATAIKEQEKQQTYTRPGTGYVVHAKTDGPSPHVDKILEERKKELAPTASLTTLDDYFCGKPVSTSGYAEEIFDLYKNNKGDMTVTEKALALLPTDHVLSVHTFQPSKTEQGEPTITVQNAKSANGSPVQYTGVVKYQTQERDFRVDMNVMFDLTGKTKPIVSVVKQTPCINAGEKDAATPQKDEFAQELEKLSAGVMNVAIYAPEGSKVPTSAGGSQALRQKINLQ